MAKAILYYYINFLNFRGRTSKRSFLLARQWVVGSKIGALVICLCYLVANVGNDFFVAYPKAIIFYTTWWAVHIVPSISLGVRRYHDLGYKGWGYLGEKLLWYVSVFIFSDSPDRRSDPTSTEGEPQQNRYGPAPVN